MATTRARQTYAGYHPFLEERLRPVLPACVERAKIVGNLGVVNPTAYGKRVAQLAREWGSSDSGSPSSRAM